LQVAENAAVIKYFGRPSRWLKKSDGQTANPVSEPVPGVWGHLMTFIGK
jgi:hypothetical protein